MLDIKTESVKNKRSFQLILQFDFLHKLGQKKKYVCFLLHLQKIRVGRSLLIFFILNFYFLFSLILPRNTTNVLFA